MTSQLISSFRNRNDKTKNLKLDECAKIMREHDEQMIKRQLQKREMMRKQLYKEEICVFNKNPKK